MTLKMAATGSSELQSNTFNKILLFPLSAIRTSNLTHFSLHLPQMKDFYNPNRDNRLFCHHVVSQTDTLFLRNKLLPFSGFDSEGGSSMLVSTYQNVVTQNTK
jgi:hypothetical protein